MKATRLILITVIFLLLAVGVNAVILDDLEGCYDYDSSANKSFDRSTNLRNLTSDTNLGWTADGYMGGGGVYAQNAQIEALMPGFTATDWSYCTWVNSSDTPANGQQPLADASSPYWEFHIGQGGNSLRIYIDEGPALIDDWTYTYTQNEWFHACWVTDVGVRTELYINGESKGNKTNVDIAWNDAQKQMGGPANSGLDAVLDNTKFWSRPITYQEVLEDYNSNTSICATAPAPPGPTFNTINISEGIPLSNAQFSTNPINFNAFVNATYTFNCSLYLNGTLNFTNVNYSPGTEVPVNFFRNLTNSSHSYYISCYDNTTNVNTSTNVFYVDTSTPTFTTTLDGNNTFWTKDLSLNITAIDEISLYSLNVTDSCGNSYYNNSGLVENTSILWNTFNCSPGSKQTYVTLCDGFVNPLTCVSKSFSWDNMARLNITAWNLINSSPLNNFNIFEGGLQVGTTTTGLVQLNNLTPGIHNISITSLGMAPTSKLINISGINPTYNFTLHTTNSVSIFIRQESNNSLIPEKVTMTFTSGAGDFVNTTSTGSLYLDNLNASTYVVLFNSDNYSARTYTITVGNDTTQTLTAYLSANTSTTLFTIADDDSAEVLEGVFATMLRVINGTWQPVESKYTDITGKVQFNYVENANYKFFLSKLNYDDYVFYLNPILFAEYDIKMEKTTAINYSSDFDKLSVIYSPSQFNNNAVTTFDFIISAPYGTLVNYGINLTYPGGSNISSGVNAIGEQLTLNIFVVNATVFNTVRLDYYYTTSVSGLREFTVLLPIMFPNGTGSSHTFIANKDTTFGLSVFERVLIMTFVVLMVIGIATLVGQPLPGLALGLFVFGYCVFIGFIPIWAILPSMLIGVLFLMWKSGGY